MNITETGNDTSNGHDMSNRIFIMDNLDWLSSDYPHEDGYDVIYIDPPYNTGSSFSYNDNRNDWNKWFLKRVSKTRTLMKDDSAIFISIDDSKIIEVCEICDQVFKRRNRIGILITHQSQRSNSKHLNVVHEYIVAYAKDIGVLPEMSVPRSLLSSWNAVEKLQQEVEETNAKSGINAAQNVLSTGIKKLVSTNETEMKWLLNYRKIDSEGKIFYPTDLSVPGKPREVDLPEIGLHLDPLDNRGWSSNEKFISLHDNGMLCYLDGRPYEKHYLDKARYSMQSILPFYSRQGTEDLKRLGCTGLFDTPKPVEMVMTLIASVVGNKKKINVLDYFAGSGTTAQACYYLEKRTGIEVSYDLVQIMESISSKSKANSVARELGVPPTIPDAMLYRIRTYIEKNDIDDEPDIIKMERNESNTSTH